MRQRVQLRRLLCKDQRRGEKQVTQSVIHGTTDVTSDIENKSTTTQAYKCPC
jgi:hypothetical protein